LAISRYPFPSKLTLSFGDPWIGEDCVLLFGRSVGNITPANLKAVNALLKDYHVDVSGDTLNTLTPGDAFGSANFSGDTFTPPANFFWHIDQWMASGLSSHLPATSLYVLTIADRSDVGGVDWRTDPARFAARLRSFAQVWEDHLRRLGIDPRRVAFMYSDEPNDAEAQRNLIAWGTALQRGRRGAGAHVRLTTDASPNPAADVHLPFLASAGTGNDVYAAADIPCPGWNTPTAYHAVGFFKKLVRSGKALGFYGADFHNRTGDPYTNGVVLGWYQQDLGATFRFYNYLKYQDQAQTMNAYTDANVPTPLYFDDGARVYSSRAMESIYEGREDYEYATIARSLIQQLRSISGEAEAAEQASRTVDDAVAAVVAPLLNATGADFTAWTTPKDRGVADRERSVLWDLIGQLDNRITQHAH
jgi:hypothetical protein